MALPVYLAMTGSEFTSCCPANYYPAWMACHFSPYSEGLSNYPPTLSGGSMLIINDRIPPNGHDKEVIVQQLLQLLENGNIQKVLLDFQRQKTAPLCDIAQHIVRTLPCPVAVTPQYVQDDLCPVCVPPIAPCTFPKSALGAFQGREIWLELSFSPTAIRITKDGAVFSEESCPLTTPVHRDDALHCHYQFAVVNNEVHFSLYRTLEDLSALLESTKELGVTCGIGLYQELFPKSI